MTGCYKRTSLRALLTWYGAGGRDEGSDRKTREGAPAVTQVRGLGGSNVSGSKWSEGDMTPIVGVTC